MKTALLRISVVAILLMVGAAGCSRRAPEPTQPSPEKPGVGAQTPPALPAAKRGSRPAYIQSFTRWKDPKESAFEVLVPKDWQVSGGTMRVNTDYTFQLEATRDKAQFLLRYPVPAQNWVPTPYTAMLGIQEGTFFKSLGFDWFLLRYYPPREYISQLIVEPMKQQYPDVHIIEVQDLPDLAISSKVANATLAEASSATVAFSAGGRPIKAGFTVVTNYFAGPDNSALWVATVFGAIAPETEFEQVSRLAMIAIASLKVDPAWLEAEIKGAKARQKIVEATARKLQDLNYQMLREESRATLNIGGNWASALGGDLWKDDKGNPLPDPGSLLDSELTWAKGPDGEPALIVKNAPDPPGFKRYE